MRQKPQNPNIDREWFLDRLEEREISVRGLARMLEIDPSSCSLMLRGVRRISPDEAIGMADILNTTPSEIFKRAGAPMADESRSIPVKYFQNDALEVREIPSEARDEFKAPYDTPTNAYAIQMRSASLTDGWVAVVNGTKRGADDLIGQYSLICLNSGDMMMGVIRKGYRAGTHNINPSLLALDKMLENQDVLWASEVLWIRPIQHR